jgi:hypothetical protein
MRFRGSTPMLIFDNICRAKQHVAHEVFMGGAEIQRIS